MGDLLLLCLFYAMRVLADTDAARALLLVLRLPLATNFTFISYLINFDIDFDCILLACFVVVVVGHPPSVHYSTLGPIGYILKAHTCTPTCGDTLSARGCYIFIAAGVTR